MRQANLGTYDNLVRMIVSLSFRLLDSTSFL